MWKFQGEVACGPGEEEGEEVAEPARSPPELSRLQLARASHPVRLWGHWAGNSPPGPRSHSLSPASHHTFPLGHRYSDGLWCQLERVPPCSASGGERTGRHHSAPHLRPLASALLGLCLVCDQRVGEAREE